MSYVTEEEIYSQAGIWSTVLEKLSNRHDEYEREFNQRTGSEQLFVGCGSSYYLGMCAASVFTHLTKTRSRAVPASEITLFPHLTFASADSTISPFLISRSGTTTEVIEAGRQIQEQGFHPLSGVSCRSGSNLIDLVSNPYLISDADEESVVMTRSFTSMLLLLQGFAAIATDDNSFLNQLHELDHVGQRLFDDGLDVAEEITQKSNCREFVFLGQGPYYGLAQEAALKVKEMSLSHSDAYHSLEFRHGPRSLVNARMLITFLMSDTAREQEVKLMEEMGDTEATVFVICEERSDRIEQNANFVQTINSELDDFARLILYLPVVQLLGFHMALKNGENPDDPSNLTQVVEL